MQSHTPARQAKPIKLEQAESVIELFAKALERYGSRSTATPAAQARPTTTPRSGSECHYCNELGHGIRVCPKVEKDMRQGLIKRNAESKIVLPGGGYPPRSIEGKCMRDCILEWHRQNPNNVAVGSLSYMPSQQPSGSTLTLLLAVASASPSPATATYSLTADEERRMYNLKRELMALRTKNNNGPLRRSPRTHAGAVPAQPTSRATPEPTGTTPAPATAAAPAAPPAAPAPPPEAAPPPQVALRAAKHPFAHARDATYAPPTDRNVGAPPPKQSKETREPTYRMVAPIDNPETLGQVLDQVLKAPSVHLSNAELLAISPPLRDELCKQLTPK